MQFFFICHIVLRNGVANYHFMPDIINIELLKLFHILHHLFLERVMHLSAYT